MAKYYTQVTEKGIEALNTSISSNKAFGAIKMAVGDSNGSYYEPEKTQTELKNQKYIANCYAKGKRENYLYFDLQLPPSVGDFYIREVGLFDKDLNLLAVAKYPETLKTKADGSLEKTLNIELRIELSEEALKQVVIDEAGNLVRTEELDKYQLLEEKDTANGYVGLNSESQIAHKHIPFGYNVFCVNTGVLNDDGEVAFLTINENVLSTNGNFDITTANGKTYTITDVLTLDTTNLADDTYNLFIDPIAKTLSASTSTIFTGNKFPENAVVGDYLLNTAKIPYDLEQKTSDSVQKGLNTVFIGTLAVSGGGKTVVMNKFNENILKEKIPTKTSELTNDSNYVDTAVISALINIVPDYTSGVTLTSGDETPSSGVIVWDVQFFNSSISNGTNYTLSIDGVVVLNELYRWSTYTKYGHDLDFQCLVGKGQTIEFTRGTVTFYPYK